MKLFQTSSEYNFRNAVVILAKRALGAEYNRQALLATEPY